MIFTLQDLHHGLPGEVVETGRSLLQLGQVSASNILRNGELVTGVIEQTNGRPLRVYARIQQAEGRITILGECSCEARENCAHVAATLLHALGDVPSLAAGTRHLAPTAQEAPSAERPNQRLLYRLIPQGDELLVETCVGRPLGEMSHEICGRFEPAQGQLATPARFLEAIDLELLPALDRSPRGTGSPLPRLAGASSAALFGQLIATERCYFEQIEGCPPLRRGQQGTLHVQWNADRFGRQQLAWRTSPPADRLLPLSQFWCLDTSAATCSPLQCDLPDELVRQLMALPPIPPDQAQGVLNPYQEAYPGVAIPPLQLFEPRTLPRVRPIACLHLKGIREGAREDIAEHPHARLLFSYHDIEIGHATPATRLREGQLIQVQRDEIAEQAALGQLLDLGLAPQTHEQGTDEETDFLLQPRFPETREQAWIDFQLKGLPRLQAQGWRIVFDRFHHRLVEASQWVCDVKRLERQAWFNISMRLEIEGRQVELLPILLQLLGNLPADLSDMQGFIGQHYLFPMQDEAGENCLLRLPGERVLQILELLLEICGGTIPGEDTPLQVNQAQLTRLMTLDATGDDDGLHWSDEASQQLAQRLKSLTAIAQTPPPAGLQASLRPYQQQGLDWLQFLREYALSGILADDMGLGKTLQVLAHLLTEKASGRADRPSLVVVPTSLTFNWRHEAARFAPELKVFVLHGAQRKSHFKRLARYDLVITTYPLLARDQEALMVQPFHLLILDEAQTIKNPKSHASRVVRQLNARHRLCLTGTPMENHLGELWSLFDFLMPGLLGDNRTFRRHYRTPIETHGDEKSTARLSRRIRPFLLRRTKGEVAKELPEKTEIVQTVSLEAEQRALYETVRLSMHRRVREEIERQGLARSRILVLDALMKLRQVCCDPRLLKSEKAQGIRQSAKLDHLMALLGEMIEEGRRILLFSQFTSMLALIEAEVRKADFGYVKLIGQTRDRETPVKQFQNGKVPLFLISLKAGGVGLNLTAADTIIHYDPWWNPAVERQATDRSHRIGQQQAVFVYKLICEGTLEEKILALQQRKQQLADNLYGQNGEQALPWNEQDLDELFAPLSD